LDGIDLPETHGVSGSEDIVMDREVLVQAMNKLDDKHRLVLILRYFDDLSYDEIATVVGVRWGR